MSKATVLVAPKPNQIELQQQEVPPPGPGEIQIRAHCSLVSHGTERAYILRLPGTEWVKFPCYPGYASAGTVEAVGDGVEGFKVGDRVFSSMSHRSLGNYAVDRGPQKLPEGVSFEQSTFVALGTTALQGIRKARIEVTESVAVFGLGIVGQLATQFARINGGLPVIGLDRVQARMDLARSCGANVTIDTSNENWMSRLKDLTGDGPNVAIEASGFPDVIPLALQVVAHFGRVVLVGSPRGESTVNFYRDVHCKQVTIIGAHNGQNPKVESRPGFWTRKAETDSVLTLLAEGRMNTDALITERITPGQILDTFKKIIAWKFDAMVTLIEWTK